MGGMMVITGVLAVLGIASFVCFVIVLIQLFKQKGVLHGLLGIVCGIYTFIWGWIRHGDLGLTKVMLVWSGLMVVSLLGNMFLPAFMVGMLSDDFAQMTQQFPVEPASRPVVANIPKVAQKAAVKPSAAEGNWQQQAADLWQNGRYQDPQQALTLLNKAIDADADATVAYNNRGLAHRQLGQFDAALKDFTQAVRLNDNYAEAYSNRGMTYYDKGSYALAIAEFEKAIEIRTDYLPAYLNRGLAHFQQDEIPAACADFTRACELGDCQGVQWADRQGICR